MTTGRLPIAHLTSAHPPNDIRIFVKQCRSLAAHGFDVTLVAPKLDRFDAGQVRHVAIDKPDSRLGRMVLGAFRVFLQTLRTPAKVVHLHDPELVPFGFLLKLLGRRVIVDVHEDLPKQIASKEWLPKAVRPAVAAAMRGMNGFISIFADAIVAATPSIARNFHAGKTIVVQNFPIEAELVVPQPSPYATRPKQIVYVGALTRARGAAEMVAAMNLVAARHPDALLLIAGSTSPASLEDELRRAGKSHTQFLGQLGRAEVAKLFAQCRMGLVLFHPEPNHVEAQPNKLFEYMSAGLPLVGSCFPLWQELIAGESCGKLVDPLDVNAIAEAICWLLEHEDQAETMGRRGAEAVRTRYNWAAETAKLFQVYDRLSQRL